MTATHDRTQLDAIRTDRDRLVAELEAAAGRIQGAKVWCPFHSNDKTAAGSLHQDAESGAWFYTCHGCTWNHGKRSGDVLAVVQAAQKCDFKTALGHLGVSGNSTAPSTTGGNGHRAKVRPSPDDIAAAEKLATDSAKRLQADDGALDHLMRSRGIDAETARRLGLGITGASGRRYVTMPICNTGGDFIAVKAHALDGQSLKSWWNPKGTNREQLFPVCLDGPEPVWICPGELKAAALIGIGLPAIGITSGEGSKDKATTIPDRATELIRSCGKAVAFPPDDDATGKLWGETNRKVVDDAGLDARIIDPGLDSSVGLNDIGDWITRELIENARDVEGVRESLLHAYEQSDPWRKFTLAGIIASPRTFAPVTCIPTGFPRWDQIAGGGLRTRGVHLIPGKPGMGKSTLAVQVASNAAFAGVPVGIISFEMTREDVAKLVVAQNTGIPRRVLDSGDCYVEAFNEFKAKAGETPLTILDDDYWEGPLDREGLAKLIGEGTERFGWKLVVVDYLGLLAPVANEGTFDADLKNSSALKRMASRYDIALLVVAALRKFSPGRKEGEASKVTLDDVSGAGRITYDATSVWFVESEQQPTSPPSGTIWLHALKARFSGAASLGEVFEFRWSPHTGQITDSRSYR